MVETAARDAGDEEDRVLLVDDDPINLKAMVETLRGLGLKLQVANSGEAALKVAARARPQLILLDVMMPGMDGYETCQKLKQDEATADAAVIFLSGLDDAGSKVRGLELGAVDFLSKPFQPQELILRVKTHITLQRLRRKLEGRNRDLEHELTVARELLAEARLRVETDLAGDSSAVRALREAIAEQARGGTHVLLTGPPGAGQEAAARSIHHQSARAQRAFIHVNCSLLESTHSWHFLTPPEGTTGGDFEPGKLALAAGGTLYLEGIQRMPRAIQEQLARLLAGEDRSRGAVDVRVIANAATDLASEVGRSQFHAPLYQQIASAVVRVPGLSERKDDIPELARRFVAASARRIGALVEGLSETSLGRLKAYFWPGNLRELQNLIERAVVTATGPTVEIDADLLEGGVKLGAYRLLDKLGAGGMGEVWRAKHQLLARPAAVKLIRANLDASADRAKVAARFRREAQATASLCSPHTVRLYDFGVSDAGELYYVMELLEGIDFDDLVKRFGPLPAERAVYLVRQALRSLEEAHDAGLLHRDIKPANLFVCKLGSSRDFVKVLDFGIVKSLAGDDVSQPALTADGVITGTPAFLSPEAVMRPRELDGRADLYAIGCILFFALTGQLPFTGPDLMTVLFHQIHTPAGPPSAVAKQPIPKELDALVLRCLAKKPADRPASARELWHELGGIRLERAWDEDQADRWWAQYVPGSRSVAKQSDVLEDDATDTSFFLS